MNHYKYLTDADLEQIKMFKEGLEGLRHPMSKEHYFLNIEQSTLQHMIQELESFTTDFKQWVASEGKPDDSQ